jgi:hypothetical protein
MLPPKHLFFHDERGGRRRSRKERKGFEIIETKRTCETTAFLRQGWEMMTGRGWGGGNM